MTLLILQIKRAAGNTNNLQEFVSGAGDWKTTKAGMMVFCLLTTCHIFQFQIQTCPAERLMHQTALLRKSRRENGHFFLSAETLRLSKSLKAPTTQSVRPTPSLNQPAQQ